MIRQFHLGDILSVTTGCLLSPRHMDGVYDLLNYMTGESLFTHQLPRASIPCGAALRQQYPALAEVAFDPTTDQHCVDGWLAEQVKVFGEMHVVQPLSPGIYEAKHPLTELEELVDRHRIAVVLMPPDGEPEEEQHV